MTSLTCGIYKNEMEDGSFTLTRDEQMSYIKIEARRGKSAIEIGSECLSGMQFYPIYGYEISTMDELLLATSTCSEGLWNV